MPTWLASFLSRTRAWLSPARAEREFAEELEAHLEMLTGDNIRKGLAPEQARRAAKITLGGHTQLAETNRELRGLPWLETALQDVRYALRMLRKAPGFTAVAVLTFALGIGANTAVFSVVDAVLLRPLPYREPGQLVLLSYVPLQRPDALLSISYRDFTEVRERNHIFRELAGSAFHDLTLTGAGEPAIVNTASVIPELFSLLNANPLAGRTLLPDDGKPGAPAVAVLSENLWRSRFGANPALLGQTIALDMRPFTVVGILPASFRFPDGAARQDAWIAVAQDPLFGPLMSKPNTRLLAGLARLRPGVSLAQAEKEMHALGAQLAQEFPAQDSGLTLRVRPYREAVVGNVRPALLILLGAAGLVLLIACANIANLLLSRASSRGREIAVRIALGAGRARIVRQLLTETALLGLFGGVAGVLLAAGSVRGLRPFLPPQVVQIASIHVGAPVLAFALLISLAATLAFGLAPAFLATPSTLQTNIKEGAQRTGHRGGLRLRSFLAIAEISLAMVLLVGGGLLMRSFALVLSVNPGFDPKNVIEAEVSLPQFQYSKPSQWTAFAGDLLLRLHAQPGLGDSALAAPLPMDRQGAASFVFSIVGNAPLPPGKSTSADYATVSPGYFGVMRIPLLRGRFFSEQDSPANPNVAIISETLARRYFADRDPIGQQMRFGFPPNVNVPREIVGVVGDVRDVALSQMPGPMMYVPFAQAPLYGGEVVVRSSLSPSGVAAGIRQAVHAIDRDLPVTDIEPFPDALGASIAQERFRTLLLGSFSGIALLLAAVGIFGVISYSAAQRTQEIGIRMALGAERRNVLWLILGQGAKLALVGLAAGTVAALLLTRSMASLLYGISATDPLTFAGVAAVLLAVAVLACYLPARRAMRVDPVVALRYQ